MEMELFNCQELSAEDMLDIDGGILPLLIVGAVCLLMASCQSNTQGGYKNKQINVQFNYPGHDTTVIKHSDGSRDSIIR